ncbi:MAG TPA: Holliday junction branch migration protein RuvA [Candidatus Paceibacterota bacterium]|nr:Holliday junction branch migration protein RuvA [Candidatus Paceibacterota bacterium]HON21796.1 Holliday junction branch migration protein RuvA [Candidatus Paceibacterota bacterium]HOV88746.1 Holliday junction branch migration protein RuvA [Candidatus Paceibacterota bacterium]HRU33696.1 Holliday junction branch migration protein RuvA [Candidatus Paceibacterota bacterium]
MLYFIDGEVVRLSSKFIVLKSGDIAFRIFVHPETIVQIGDQKEKIRVFVYLNVKENALELYGFLTQEELEFFELLNSVAGVGPKSALALLGLGEVKNLKAAILSNKADVLTKAPGIGRKTAERIILELKSKVSTEEGAIEGLESDLELEDALLDLGYSKSDIRKIINQVPNKQSPLNERLKAALKLLGEKK